MSEESTTDRSPSHHSHADRTLADRVDAIERALTDASADSSDSEPADTDVTTTDLSTTAVDPARVDALETDLAELRAAVDALRGVVGDIDQRVPEEAAASTRREGAVERADGPERSDATATERGALYAPTGREIPPTSTVSSGDDSDAEVMGESPERPDEGEARSGLFARVSDSL